MPPPIKPPTLEQDNAHSGSRRTLDRDRAFKTFDLTMPSRQELRDHDLLSPSAYDDDVTSPRSLSEQDSDSEDDEFLRANRSSMELARHDKTVLEEEEEMEKLLVRSGPADGLRRIFSPTSGPVRIGKRDRSRRRERKRSIQGKPHQEGDLMFEMEEGFRDFSDVDSIDSFNLDEKDVDDWQDKPVSQGKSDVPSQANTRFSRCSRNEVYVCGSH